MSQIDPETIHAAISVSPARRVAAYGVQLALGAVLVYAGFAGMAGFVASVVFVLAGIVVLWGAERLRRASRVEIYLTDAGLYDTSGAQPAAVAQMASGPRRPYARKPPAGFAPFT